MNLIDNSGVSRRKLFLNLVVLIIALVSYTKRDYRFDESTFFEKAVIDIYTPIQEKIVSLQRDFGSFIDHYFQNVQASKDNVELLKSVSELENKVFQLEEIRKENERLKELLEFGEELPGRKVLAQIVAWDASSDFKVLRINKGLNNGLSLQSTVVTADGLVGYIYRLTNNYADILTILDANNRIDGLIQRTRSHGIVEGFSGRNMMMKYVQRTEPVILGDTVITSGLGNVYPKGLKVGKISRVERQSYGITQYIEVSPAVDFGSLEEVIVIVPSDDLVRRQEWEALDHPHVSDMEGGQR